MHHEKNRGNKEIALALLSRILAQSCIILCLNNYNNAGREKVGPPKGGVATLPTTPTGLDGGIGC